MSRRNDTRPIASRDGCLWQLRLQVQLVKFFTNLKLELGTPSRIPIGTSSVVPLQLAVRLTLTDGLGISFLLHWQVITSMNLKFARIGCVGGPLLLVVQVGGYSNRGVAAVHTQAFRCFALRECSAPLRVKPASDTGRGNSATVCSVCESAATNRRRTKDHNTSRRPQST